MTFLEVWIGYAIFGATVFALGFGWAVRHKQFSDMESARHIPVRAESTIEPDRAQHSCPSRADIASVAGILLTAAAVIVAVLFVGWRSA